MSNQDRAIIKATQTLNRVKGTNQARKNKSSFLRSVFNFFFGTKTKLRIVK